MQTYLEQVVEDIVKVYGKDVGTLSLVLPNKRAGLFIKKHFAKHLNQTNWLPQVYGTQDFVDKITEATIVNNLTLIFELYQVYTSSYDNAESLEEFYSWGKILLQDYNEIDRYLLPSEKLFSNISELRALEVWNLNQHPLTDFEKKYLDFWKIFEDLYYKFNEHLIEKKIAYQGKAYKEAARLIIDNAENIVRNKLNCERVVFIGFNALNAAEQTIIKTLKKSNLADVYWDADEYYVNDEYQEAGLFLREFFKESVFDSPKWISNKLISEEKNINVYGVPQNVGQAKNLPSILKTIKTTNNYQDTAVVLADENLLVPTLQSIPPSIEHVNVTMGYPLKNTPLCSFFELFFNSVLNAQRFGNKNKLTYHYKDVLSVLKTDYAKVLLGNEACEELTKTIVSKNIVFINETTLDKNLDLFEFSYTVRELVDKCLLCIKQLANHFEKQTSKLEHEYLYQFTKLFNQIDKILDDYSFINNIKSFILIYKQLLNTSTVELYGEPLLGLQVMGVLETRNIDFKNVVILSVNEGILPAGKSDNSFIPYDIKKVNKLPTHHEKDAIYAYHFYRLIQNSTNIHILYNTEVDDYGTGEKSRYITQLENELKSKNNQINFNQSIVNYPIINQPKTEIRVTKEEHVIERIKELLFSRGLSPSAINTYLSCSLDYYYKYVLKIAEVDEVEEIIEHSTFGEIIHDVLEQLYQPFIGKVVKKQDLLAIKKMIEQAVVKRFEQDFSQKEFSYGRNLITLKVIINYINRFISKEIELVEQNTLTIIGLEKEYEAEVPVIVNGKKHQLKLKGKVDRIDTLNGITRIIDYKSGKVEEKDLIVKFESADENLIYILKEQPKALQLLTYAYLFFKNNSISKLQAGIKSFKNLNTNLMLKFNDQQNLGEKEFAVYENVIISIAEEMFDEQECFTHNVKIKYCMLCDK